MEWTVSVGTVGLLVGAADLCRCNRPCGYSRSPLTSVGTADLCGDSCPLGTVVLLETVDLRSTVRRAPLAIDRGVSEKQCLAAADNTPVDGVIGAATALPRRRRQLLRFVPHSVPYAYQTGRLCARGDPASRFGRRPRLTARFGGWRSDRGSADSSVRNAFRSCSPVLAACQSTENFSEFGRPAGIRTTEALTSQTAPGEG